MKGLAGLADDAAHGDLKTIDTANPIFPNAAKQSSTTVWTSHGVQASQ